jgi:hypothetical protein
MGGCEIYMEVILMTFRSYLLSPFSHGDITQNPDHPNDTLRRTSDIVVHFKILTNSII